MGLREQFSDQLKAAMKAKDVRRVSTLRLVLSALKDRDIANRTEASREGIGDDEILTLLAKMIKQREESAAVYDSGGRPELATHEREEVEIIKGFMPKQMSADEVLAAAKAASAETGAASMKDMGKVMAALRAQYAATLDMAKAGPLVKARLGPPAAA